MDNRVSKWNNRVGKPSLDKKEIVTETGKTALKNQVLLINEEINETKDAIVAKDRIEILDGVVDVRVVTEGLLHILGEDVKKLREISPCLKNGKECEIVYKAHIFDEIELLISNMTLGITTERPDDVEENAQLLLWYNEVLAWQYGVGEVYEEAYNEIMDNNDLKYTTCFKTACDSVDEMTTDNTTYLIESVSDDELGSVFSIHRAADNKVMKFPGHPRVDLTKFVK